MQNYYNYNGSNYQYNTINSIIPTQMEKKRLRKVFNGIGIALLCAYLLTNIMAVFGLNALSIMGLGFVYNAENVRVIQPIEMFVVGCTPAICFLIVFFIYSLIKGEKVTSLFNTKNVTVPLILKACILTLFCQEFSSILHVFLNAALNANGLEVTFFNYELSTDKSTTFIDLFSSIILAPVAEELFFRGIVLKKSAKISQTFAIFFTSLIFGLMHSNPYQLIGGFLMGIPLAYFTIKTGSLIPSLICHIVVNINASLGTIIGFFNDKIYENIFFPLMVIILIFGGITFIIMKSKNELKLPDYTDYHKKRTLPIAVTSWSMIVIMGIYIFDIFDSVSKIPPEQTKEITQNTQEIIKLFLLK